MTKNTKIIIWIVIAILVIGGIWWWNSSMQNTNQALNYQTQNTPAPANSGNNGNTTGNSGAISASDNSNASLNSDLSNMDTQMAGFSSDSASINQGLNDQPVPQGQ
jgi:hypothetical protein